MADAETVTDMKGNIVKMEVDYSETCDKKIPECEEMAKNGKLSESLEMLLSLEKQTRSAADMFSTSRILVAVMKICFASKQLEILNEHLLLLTKRRGQLKGAVCKMVQEACEYVDQVDNKDEKLKLIDTLRTVSAGKIYLELERARITRKLASIKEAEGDISEAANILQELQVETYGSMERREKVEYILEQMRLCMAKKDYIRTQIICKKINVKFFENDKEQDLKLKYYELMIKLGHYEGKYFTICKHYRNVFNTPLVKEDNLKMKEALRNVVIYIILSAHDNEQSDLLARVSEEALLEEIPIFRQLLKNFTTTELIHWARLKNLYEKELCEGSEANPCTGVFDMKSDEGKKRWDDLKKRVVEHNIRVMSKYYTQMTMKRMGSLLDLSVEEAEKFLADLVTAKTVYAKIDRLNGIVVFQPPKDAGETMNSWSRDISDLMHLLNKTTHLITKEQMVHQLLN